jgi:hypothetical protein
MELSQADLVDAARISRSSEVVQQVKSISEAISKLLKGRA